ncbi:MAG: DUF6920 family protein [Actinomycetota bacterium]
MGACSWRLATGRFVERSRRCAASEILRAYPPARFREARGEYAPTPWSCACQSYAQLGGMRIPREGEVEWILPEGRSPYWRGRIVTIQYR